MFRLLKYFVKPIVSVSQRVLGYDPTYGRFAFLGPAHGYDHTYGVFAFLRSVTSKRLFWLLWVTPSWTLRWLELLNLSCLSMCLACHIILMGTGMVLARLREKAAIPSQRYMAGTGPCSWSEPTMLSMTPKVENYFSRFFGSSCQLLFNFARCHL